MADDERRAEIDAVRDARGDDERLPDEEPHYSCTRDHCSEGRPEDCWAARSPQGEDQREPWERALDNAYRGPLESPGSPSPQGEDHEAGIETAAKALWEFDEEPNAEGIHGPQWEQANEWEREDYRNRVRVVLDRLRDARGDDEAPSPWAHLDRAFLEDLYARALVCITELEAARNPQDEDHETGEWPNVEMVRCRDVGDLLHGHRCGYAGTNELACPNHIPCPGHEYVPLSRVSSSRDGSVAVEARAILRDVARTRRSDAWGMVVIEAQQFLDEHPDFGSPASTGDQAPEGDRST